MTMKQYFFKKFNYVVAKMFVLKILQVASCYGEVYIGLEEYTSSLVGT